MSLSICSFASGSGGNCTFVSSGSTKILIDVGIPIKKVEENLRQLGEGTDNLSILVTHAHTDHIKEVPSLADKYRLPVYAHRKTAQFLRSKITKSDSLVPFNNGDFFVGDITVSPFSVSHDVHCVGYSLYHQERKITVVTDLGRLDHNLTDYIKDSDAVLLESNHDLELIIANPNYSPWLKRRILSDKGHLSNTTSAEAAKELVKGRTKNIILGHLSEENNYPELAFSAVCSHLAKNGIKEGRDVCIEVAPASSMSRLIKVV